MLVRGKIVILTIFALAFAAAGFSVWYRYQQSRQAVTLWGADHAGRIRNASQVEIWRERERSGSGPHGSPHE